MVRFLRLALLGGLLCGCGWTAERWRLQYFLDEDQTSLALRDLRFPTPERGVAVGDLVEGRRSRPVALLTTDGGAHWSTVELPDSARSLFFLSERLGWMVAAGGVWRSGDGGNHWKRLAPLRGLLRVHFLDEQRGYAVGAEKAVYETHDGGHTWTPLKAAAEPKSSAEFTVYRCLDFLGHKLGLIVGSSRPPRSERQRFPDWMQPERAPTRREVPSLTILLETRDGGQNWRSSLTSAFGAISQIKMSSRGGLVLVRFLEWFDWPCEVLWLDWATGRSSRAFRQTDRDITDVAILPDGVAYLAGYEPSGRLPHSPVPGKLKILKSSDWTDWQEMQVDYRAVARRVVLAAAGPGQVWAATDTGMILKLAEE